MNETAKRNLEKNKGKWFDKETGEEFPGNVLRDLDEGDQIEYEEEGKLIAETIKEKRSHNGLIEVITTRKEV